VSEVRSSVKFLGTAVLAAVLLAGCGGSESHHEDDSRPLVSKPYLKNMSRSLGEFYKIDHPPRVKVVRAVLPEEVDDVVQSCVAEQGFALTADGVVNIPQGQDDAYNLAGYTCRMRYPVIERYAQPLKTKQIGIQYDWTVKFLIPCLERQGHAISDVPTKARFIDTWNSDPFYPLAQVELDQTNAAEYNQAMSELEKSCPQMAPAAVTWDGLSVAAWMKSHGQSGVANEPAPR
jgi:hypothetical protein